MTIITTAADKDQSCSLPLLRTLWLDSNHLMPHTILCPVDFSSSSANALEYAIEFGSGRTSEIVLLNIFSIPVASADAFVFVPGPEEIEEIRNAYQARMDEWLQKYRPAMKAGMSLSGHVRYGEPTNEILLMARDIKPDLLVMGLQGEGFIKERIIGSTATQLMTEYERPLMVVPSECRYKPIHNIVFFYDGKDFRDEHVLSPLVETADAHNAGISVCTIVPELKEFPEVSDKLVSESLQPSLANREGISFKIVQSNHFLEGAEKFMEENGADLVFVVKRKHSFLDALFRKGHSKLLAFHTTVPLLSSLD